MTPTREELKAAMVAVIEFVESPFDMLTTDPSHCDACRELHETRLCAATLRAHLATFDAERDLLEAAMEVSRIIDKYDPWATVEAKGISISPDSNPFKALRDAYRALVAAKEKP